MASVPPLLARLDEALVRLLDRRLFTPNGTPIENARAADEILVNAATFILREELMERRRKGLTCWHEGRGLNKMLAAELTREAKAGNTRAVLRLAAVIHAREHLYGPDA